MISPFTISYPLDQSQTMDGCNGKYIDTDIAADTLYSYTVLLVNSSPSGTHLFKLNRTITDSTTGQYERGVSSITAQLFA